MRDGFLLIERLYQVVFQRLPSQIDLKDRFDKSIPDKSCPVAECVRKAEQVLIAATVTGRGGRQVSIESSSIAWSRIANF